MVEVVTQADFDAYKAATDARLAALEAASTPMPQDVKDKLIAVLEWLKVNV
jgi:hypothetical protein